MFVVYLKRIDVKVLIVFGMCLEVIKMVLLVYVLVKDFFFEVKVCVIV